MLLELLTNPWVIIIVVVSVIVGNITALKYTANMKVGTMSNDKKDDTEKLKQLDKDKREKINKHMKENSPSDADNDGSSGDSSDGE